MKTSQVKLEFPLRVNKYIAQKGITSRREADNLITAGKVKVNGQTAVIGQLITESDDVRVETSKKAKSYLAYYKGRGVITHSPAEHETDIMTRLERDFSITHVSPIGRLDKDSEGLIILSDDGRVTGPLLDPEADHEKEYDVLVDKPVTGMMLRAMANGVDIEGYKTQPATTRKNEKNEKRFTIILTEGKKHQIRRMCAALGYQVQNLKRVRVMNVELENLKPNQYRKIHGVELKQFLNELDVIQ